MLWPTRYSAASTRKKNFAIKKRRRKIVFFAFSIPRNIQNPSSRWLQNFSESRERENRRNNEGGGEEGLTSTRWKFARSWRHDREIPFNAFRYIESRRTKNEKEKKNTVDTKRSTRAINVRRRRRSRPVWTVGAFYGLALAREKGDEARTCAAFDPLSLSLTCYL